MQRKTTNGTLTSTPAVACMVKAGLMLTLTGAEGAIPDEKLIHQGLRMVNARIHWGHFIIPPKECIPDFREALFVPLIRRNGKSSLFNGKKELNEYLNRITDKQEKANHLDNIAESYSKIDKIYRPHVRSVYAVILTTATIPTGKCFHTPKSRKRRTLSPSFKSG